MRPSLPPEAAMSEQKTRHFQEWWRHKFGFVPHGSRVVCTLCHKSIVTRTSSVRRHFNTKHGPLIPPSCRPEYISKCVAAFESYQPRPSVPSPGFGRSRKPSKATEEQDDSSLTKIWLKWNSFQANIRTILPSLLLNEQFVDVTLACDGRALKCHKVILSACSPYLAELLLQNPCQHPIILLRDLHFWEVHTLVQFMYCGEVSLPEHRLPSLLRAAHALHIKGLANVTEETNESHDSEDGSLFDKPGQKKTGRGKRKLAERMEIGEEMPKHDAPFEKIILKDNDISPKTSKRKLLENCEKFESSNHPPVQGSEDGKEIKATYDAESSQETDSEQEKYIFNMDRTLLTDEPRNPQIERHNLLEQPFNRAPHYASHD